MKTYNAGQNLGNNTDDKLSEIAYYSLNFNKIPNFSPSAIKGIENSPCNVFDPKKKPRDPTYTLNWRNFVST